MRIKTIFGIVLIVLLTIVAMQNNDTTNFVFLWTSFRLPKLVMMIAILVMGFILGLLAGRSKKTKQNGRETSSDNTNLSEEDQDYIK